MKHRHSLKKFKKHHTSGRLKPVLPPPPLNLFKFRVNHGLLFRKKTIKETIIFFTFREIYGNIFRFTVSFIGRTYISLQKNFKFVSFYLFPLIKMTENNTNE